MSRDPPRQYRHFEYVLSGYSSQYQQGLDQCAPRNYVMERGFLLNISSACSGDIHSGSVRNVHGPLQPRLSTKRMERQTIFSRRCCGDQGYCWQLYTPLQDLLIDYSVLHT